MSNSRAYRSELREQQAERTRELIATAARARFLDRGWAGTSVRSVAEAAGVSEATVYHVYGSKAGLAISLLDAAEQHADVRRAVSELQERSGDPSGQLAAFIAFDRRLFELGGDILRTLAEARRQQPDLAAAYDEGRRRGASERAKVFASWPSAVWVPGVDAARAAAIYGVLVSLETFDAATQEYGWSADEIENWWRATVTMLLLAHCSGG